MSNNYSMNLNLDRLNRLNEKLNNVSLKNIIIIHFQTYNNYIINIIIGLFKKQTTTETIKNSKYEFLANRTVDLNERLDEVINQSTNKFNIIKDNVRNNIN